MKRWVIAVVVVLVLRGAAAQAQRRPFPPRPGETADVESRVHITQRGGYRYIEANGIPNHDHGRFPNRGNPNPIRQQRYSFRVPLAPKAAATVTPLGLSPFGIAMNGVPFDPGAAEFFNRDRRSGWQYEALSGKIDLGLDANLAHVQPSGGYHYHGMPTGLIAKLGDGKKMMLVGYAADGFSIYARYGYADALDADSGVKAMRSSYQLIKGVRSSGPGGAYDGTFVEDYQYVAGSGDLDECNGRFGATPEHPEGIYHYYITD